MHNKFVFCYPSPGHRPHRQKEICHVRFTFLLQEITTGVHVISHNSCAWNRNFIQQRSLLCWQWRWLVGKRNGMALTHTPATVTTTTRIKCIHCSHVDYPLCEYYCLNSSGVEKRQPIQEPRYRGNWLPGFIGTKPHYPIIQIVPVYGPTDSHSPRLTSFFRLTGNIYTATLNPPAIKDEFIRRPSSILLRPAYEYSKEKPIWDLF